MRGSELEVLTDGKEIAVTIRVKIENLVSEFDHINAGYGCAVSNEGEFVDSVISAIKEGKLWPDTAVEGMFFDLIERYEFLRGLWHDSDGPRYPGKCNGGDCKGKNDPAKERHSCPDDPGESDYCDCCDMCHMGCAQDV